MSLEEALAENTAAMRELIGLMRNRMAEKANNGTVSRDREEALKADNESSVRRGPGRPPKENNGPSLAEVTAIAQKVKRDISREAAQGLVAKHGKKNGATNIAGLDTSVYAAFVAEAEVLLRQHEEGDADDSDDL